MNNCYYKSLNVKKRIINCLSKPFNLFERIKPKLRKVETK